MVPLSSVLTTMSAGYWGKDPGAADIDVRVIRNGDIKPDGIRWHALPTRGLRTVEVAKSRVSRGDILITTSGDCGQVEYVADEPRVTTCATNFVRRLRFDQAEVDSRFAFHYMRTRDFRSSVAPYTRGTTLQNLSITKAFEVVEIPLPSLEEQRRIAAILDQADALRAKRSEVVRRLDDLTRVTFVSSFGCGSAGVTFVFA